MEISEISPYSCDEIHVQKSSSDMNILELAKNMFEKVKYISRY